MRSDGRAGHHRQHPKDGIVDGPRQVDADAKGAGDLCDPPLIVLLLAGTILCHRRVLHSPEGTVKGAPGFADVSRLNDDHPVVDVMEEQRFKCDLFRWTSSIVNASVSRPAAFALSVAIGCVGKACIAAPAVLPLIAKASASFFRPFSMLSTFFLNPIGNSGVVDAVASNR